MSTPTLLPISPPLHRWITMDPPQEAARLETASRYRVLAVKGIFLIISLIAFAVLATYLTYGISGNIVAWAIPVAMLSATLLGMGASHLEAKGKSYAQLAEIERKVADQFVQIAGWNEAELRAFFATERIAFGSETAIHSYKPLIARYISLKQRASEKMGTIAALLRSRTTSPQAPELQLAQREVAWNLIETDLLPTILHVALARELLAHPSKTVMLSDIGTCSPKLPIERLFDQRYGSNDPYFHFIPSPSGDSLRPPIPFSELVPMDLMRPQVVEAPPASPIDFEAVRARLFPANN